MELIKASGLHSHKPMKYLLLSLSLLLSQAAFASWDSLVDRFERQEIRLVEDTAHRRVKSILLFLSDSRNL